MACFYLCTAHFTPLGFLVNKLIKVLAWPLASGTCPSRTLPSLRGSSKQTALPLSGRLPKAQSSHSCWPCDTPPSPAGLTCLDFMTLGPMTPAQLPSLHLFYWHPQRLPCYLWPPPVLGPNLRPPDSTSAFAHLVALSSGPGLLSCAMNLAQPLLAPVGLFETCMEGGEKNQ